MVSFESKADGEKLHPIDAKRKLEKSLAEIKKAKLARRAERQARRKKEECTRACIHPKQKRSRALTII